MQLRQSTHIAMTQQEFLHKLRTIKIWRQRGERAPHKPLLLLLALGHLSQGHPRLRPYREIEFELGELLNRFGPPRQKQEPAHPFLRLTSDGLWEIEGLLPHHRDRSGQLRPSRVRDSQVKGGLPTNVWRLLLTDPDLCRQAVAHLLTTYFPYSMHQELVEAVGLQTLQESGNEISAPQQRDPRFRNNVILAYEYRCAICGYDIRLYDHLVGLEAAHIRWHTDGGPDEVRNGLALCVVHHKAFDRGGIGLSDDLELLVSPALYGQNPVWEFWFSQYADQSIRLPRDPREKPAAEYLQWHRDQVFRSAR